MGWCHPVEKQITDHSVLMFLQSDIIRTSHGNPWRSIRPNLPSATHYGGALSWKSAVAAPVVGHMSSSKTDRRRMYSDTESRTGSTNRTDSNFHFLPLVLAVLSEHCNWHQPGCKKFGRDTHYNQGQRSLGLIESSILLSLIHI